MSLFDGPRFLAWWRRWHLDPWGLIIGGLLFAAATTPSLLPRSFTYQGFACGFSAASGYGLGVFLHWNWRTWAQDVAVLLRGKFEEAWDFKFPRPPRLREKQRIAVELIIIVVVFLWVAQSVKQSVHWQAEAYRLFGMRQSSPWNMLIVLPLGITVWLGILFVSHLVMISARFITRVTPDSWTVSSKTFVTWVLVIVFAMWSIDSLIPGTIIRTTERGFAMRNSTYDSNLEQVYRWQRSGSPQSLNKWSGLGSAGARFVSQGLHAEELSQLTGHTAVEPIRVYSGLGNGADDLQRSESLVAELERTGARDRKAVLVAGTTGTGWVNPTAAQAFELLFDGDTAVAAAQYSYLPSPLQFVSDKERVRDSGQVMVGSIVDWWSRLPADNRPALYIFGESLGSTQSEGAFSGIRDMTQSVDGIFWVGPPNGNDLWRSFEQRRDPGSREVAPEYSSGQTVRFAQDAADIQTEIAAGEQWRRPRVLYLQHATDPIVWWSPRLLYEEPDWLKEAPGTGRHPDMRWKPLVTFWQVSIDLLNSVQVPDGFGHNYGTAVLDGLAAITGFDGDLEQMHGQLVAAMRGEPVHS